MCMQLNTLLFFRRIRRMSVLAVMNEIGLMRDGVCDKWTSTF